MTAGKHTSKELKAEIIRLKTQGLTHKTIAIRTGLHWQTVARIVKEREEGKNG